jgi:hypothetical protein
MCGTGSPHPSICSPSTVGHSQSAHGELTHPTPPYSVRSTWNWTVPDAHKQSIRMTTATKRNLLNHTAGASPFWIYFYFYLLNGKTKPKIQHCRRSVSSPAERQYFLRCEPVCRLKANISKIILQLKKTYFNNYCFLSHVTKFTVHYNFKAEI